MLLRLCLYYDNCFAVLLAHSPADLIKEGEALHHCVGHMNYEQKVIREDSLILFVRETDKLDVPLVKMEYSIKNKKVLQCYAEHNSKPDESILDFINNRWLQYAKKQIKRLLA